MKTSLHVILMVVLVIMAPIFTFAQAPPLGTAAGFVLFSGVGAVGNTGVSQVTGNVGTNSGAITGFGNVNGVMHTSNGATAQCAADLLIAYNQLNNTVPTFFPAPLLGNGQTLNAGVYSISGAATLDGMLTLDAQGNANAVFIIQIQGPFSTAASSKVQLINGGLACNVFWKVEGLVSMAAGTTMRGTVIANNAAININAGDTLEGRALSTTGAVNVHGVLAYTPVGCGSPVLTGPAAPSMASAQCYALFSSNGPVTNAGATHVVGDVGTNVGLTTGFNPLFVTGVIHPIPDGSTAQCAADLGLSYTFLNATPFDIELLYPAQFGHNLVLTPHTYLLNAATTLTDTVYLNAMGNSGSVFILKVYGAFSTNTYSKVVLINGAQAKNVYWMVDGAVSINDYSQFKGTIVCNNGAILLKTGVILEGRAFSTTGTLGTTAVTVSMPAGCGGTTSPLIVTQPTDQTVCNGGSASFSVTATGTGLTYRWRTGTLSMSNGGNVSGANTPDLLIHPVTMADAATNYNVVITGTFAPAVISSAVSLIVNPAPVPTIGSTNNPCVGSTGNVYYTESGMSNYFWTVSVGVIVSGQGTSSINVTMTGIGPQHVSVNYANSFGCYGISPAVYNMFVNPVPGAAGIITGSGLVCAGSNAVAYTTTPVQNATSYNWTLPAGATIIAGAGTTSIVVDFSAAAVSGNIGVAGNNSCGNGIPSFLPVAVSPLPSAAGVITGPASLCAGADGVVYNVSAISGATSYLWNVPAGVTITSGATTNQIVVAFGTIAGNVELSVNGVNSCGSGLVSAGFNVSTHAIPETPVVTAQGNVLTSNAGSGNQWFYNGNPIQGETGTTYEVTSNTGNYWTVVTLLGCPSEMSNKTWIEMVGMTDTPSSAVVRVYPNPNDGVFTAAIRINSAEIYSIKVYNLLGETIMEKPGLATIGGKLDIPVDIRPANGGIYFVVFMNGEDKYIRKIFVN